MRSWTPWRPLAIGMALLTSGNLPRCAAQTVHIPSMGVLADTVSLARALSRIHVGLRTPQPLSVVFGPDGSAVTDVRIADGVPDELRTLLRDSLPVFIHGATLLAKRDIVLWVVGGGTLRVVPGCPLLIAGPVQQNPGQVAELLKEGLDRQASAAPRRQSLSAPVQPRVAGRTTIQVGLVAANGRAENVQAVPPEGPATAAANAVRAVAAERFVTSTGEPWVEPCYVIQPVGVWYQ